MIVFSNVINAPQSVTIRRFVSPVDIGAVSRRGVRTRTLDGGIYIDDRGYTRLDNALYIRFNSLDIDEIELFVLHGLAKSKNCVIAFADISGSYVYLCRIRDMSITRNVNLVVELETRLSV